MKQRSKRFHNLVVVLLCLISLVLVASSFAMLMEYSQDIRDGAGVVGLIHSNEAAEYYKSSVEAFRDQSALLGSTLLAESFEDQADFLRKLKLTSAQDRFPEIMFIRYFKDGQEYALNGHPYDMTKESSSVITGSKLGTVFCAGVVEDQQYSISAAAYCVPLKGCAYADCVVLYYPTGSMTDSIESLSAEQFSNNCFTTVCSHEGEIVSILHRIGFDIQEHNNIYEVLRARINDKATVDELRGVINNGGSGAYAVQIGGEDYVLAVSGIPEHGFVPFSVVGLYHSADIYSASYETINTVLSELAIFFLLLIFVAVYIFVNYRQNEKRIKALKDYDPLLESPTRVKFERVAAEIMARNKATLFAVAVIDIRHYNYITEQVGYEQTLQVLRHLKLLYTRFLLVDETYGYLGNGRFVLLLHYRDKETLISRLQSLSNTASTHVAQYAEGFANNLFGGVYTADRGITSSVGKMVDLAIDAENASKFPYDFGSFRIYNEMLHSSNAQTEYIEVHMESALQNNEFKVFLQAKYNINSNVPDGCEALVRWYNVDMDDYMQPDVFLQLFEANRFIIKLDHYVYEQVCICIHDCLAEKRPLYPVSVNVSRITAVEADFVSFYVETKKKYQIPDGFLTVEFTESFAYENYDRLRDIVQQLHQNGFKCSIDDFGSGFSSYNILKELPMDEIKLDRFFIEKGYSPERDYKILSSIISLGRELNMKVTQEGVETRDQLLLLKRLGCHVIQGYYYSKPLTMNDYMDFISRNMPPLG